MTVCSSAFVALGRAQSSAMGVKGLPIVVVPHPFGSRTREEIQEIAKSCAEQMNNFLVDREVT